MITVDATADATELDALMKRAGELGYLWHLFRADRHGPEVLAGTFAWADHTDVVVILGEREAHAYRVPTGPTTDVFHPRAVLWLYVGSPTWTLRALLTLPGPGHPDAPTTLIPAPPGTGIPGDRLPVRLRKRS